jgi:hypothetical protein
MAAGMLCTGIAGRYKGTLQLGHVHIDLQEPVVWRYGCLAPFNLDMRIEVVVAYPLGWIC